ncbi:MAG: hypothetical protein ACKOXF_04885 [Chitinophagaceae bacterium]
MFDNLLQLVKEHAGEAIINNPAIPNEKNDAAIGLASEGIMDQLKTIGSGGGMDAVMGLMKGGNIASNPAIAEIAGNVAGKLMSNFGLDASQAEGIVKNLVPQVMEKFVSKTNDPNDKSFDLQDVIGTLSGGGMGGVMDKLKGLF